MLSEPRGYHLHPSDNSGYFTTTIAASCFIARTNMKALRNHKDGLRIDEIDVPLPGPDDVLIKVHATSITNGELGWPETLERENPIPGIP